ARADGADISVGLRVIGVLELSCVEPPAKDGDEDQRDPDSDAKASHRSFALFLSLFRLGIGRARADLAPLFFAEQAQGAVLFDLGVLFHFVDPSRPVGPRGDWSACVAPESLDNRFRMRPFREGCRQQFVADCATMIGRRPVMLAQCAARVAAWRTGAFATMLQEPVQPI